MSRSRIYLEDYCSINFCKETLVNTEDNQSKFIFPSQHMAIKNQANTQTSALRNSLNKTKQFSGFHPVKWCDCSDS